MSNKNDKDTYVKIYRKIQYHWLWEDKPFSNGQAWIDLLIIAKRFDESFTDKKHRLIEGKSGYVYRSINDLAARWGWDRKRVSSFLDALERENMIEIYKKQGSDRTSLRIVNYSDYQDSGTSQRTSEGTTEGQAKDKSRTYKRKRKEGEKKDKKDKEAGALSSDEELAAERSSEEEYEEIDFGAMTDEEFERWMKEHGSRNL